MLWVIKLPVIRYAHLLINTGGKILYCDFNKLILFFKAYTVHAWTIGIIEVSKYPAGIDIITHDGQGLLSFFNPVMSYHFIA